MPGNSCTFETTEIVNVLTRHRNAGTVADPRAFGKRESEFPTALPLTASGVLRAGEGGVGGAGGVIGAYLAPFLFLWHP